MTQDNRRRALSEVVSLDAWHKGFSAKLGVAKLNVDVVFNTGRIGGEDDAPVRFVLRIKQAQVVIVVPPHEPAQIKRSSVSRDAPHQIIKSKISTKTSKAISASADAGLKLGFDGVSPKVSAAAKGRVSQSVDHNLTINQKLSLMSVKQVRTGEGDYAWEIKPVGSSFLDGRPWDAKKHPLLEVRDSRADRSKGIEPSIRVELRCRREDLDIDKIEYKGPNAAIRELAEPVLRQKKHAAEALIRTRLFQAGLFVGDISDRFAQIVLCASIAETDL